VAELTKQQLDFIERVGGNPRDVLQGAAAGAVFVYVEEPTQTVRYEVTTQGEARRVDTFAPRSRPRLAGPG